MQIYLFPGLGFDDRIFSKLTLSPHQCTYLNWIEPKPKETFTAYAKRYLPSIIDNGEKTILIGHSLGGMLSQEIACFRKIDLIILLSSIRSDKEMPMHFKLLGPLKLHKIFTKKLANQSLFLWGKHHGYESEEEQVLFKSMVGQQSNQYLQWAVNKLSKWKTPEPKWPTPIFQIHGDKDKTFPFRKIQQADKVIPQGSHFMVYKKPQQISACINELLDSL